MQIETFRVMLHRPGPDMACERGSAGGEAGREPLPAAGVGCLDVLAAGGQGGQTKQPRRAQGPVPLQGLPEQKPHLLQWQ